MGQSTISDLENDKKSTSAINMEAIAQALGTSSSYLLTGKQDLVSNKLQVNSTITDS